MPKTKVSAGERQRRATRDTKISYNPMFPGDAPSRRANQRARVQMGDKKVQELADWAAKRDSESWPDEVKKHD